jgi:hypothetical protein
MKAILTAVMFLGMAGQVKAASLDVIAGSAWDSVSASSNFHLLDNASVLAFKDLNHSTVYSGLSTNLYSFSYVGVDFLAVRPMNITSTYLPGIGVNVQAGKLAYDKIPAVKELADYIGKAAPLISGGNIAVGGVRNFAFSKNIWGVYGSLVAKFGQGGN